MTGFSTRAIRASARAPRVDRRRSSPSDPIVSRSAALAGGFERQGGVQLLPDLGAGLEAARGAMPAPATV